MNAPAPLSLPPQFDIPEIRKLWINEKQAEIPLLIIKDLIACNQQEPNGFKILAQKKIRPNLNADLNQLEISVQNIYQELFTGSLSYIQQNSTIIMQTFANIMIQSDDKNAAAEFLGAYVYDSVMTLKNFSLQMSVDHHRQ